MGIHIPFFQIMKYQVNQTIDIRLDQLVNQLTANEFFMLQTLMHKKVFDIISNVIDAAGPKHKQTDIANNTKELIQRRAHRHIMIDPNYNEVMVGDYGFSIPSEMRHLNVNDLISIIQNKVDYHEKE